MSWVQLLGLYLLIHKNSYQPTKVFHDLQDHHGPIYDEIVDEVMLSALAKICTSHFLVFFFIFCFCFCFVWDRMPIAPCFYSRVSVYTLLPSTILYRLLREKSVCGVWENDYVEKEGMRPTGPHGQETRRGKAGSLILWVGFMVQSHPSPLQEEKTSSVKKHRYFLLAITTCTKPPPVADQGWANPEQSLAGGLEGHLEGSSHPQGTSDKVTQKSLQEA